MLGVWVIIIYNLVVISDMIISSFVGYKYCINYVIIKCEIRNIIMLYCGIWLLFILLLLIVVMVYWMVKV